MLFPGYRVQAVEAYVPEPQRVGRLASMVDGRMLHGPDGASAAHLGRTNVWSSGIYLTFRFTSVKQNHSSKDDGFCKVPDHVCCFLGIVKTVIVVWMLQIWHGIPLPIIRVWTTFGMAFLEQANSEVVDRDSKNL
jgi:hypothetical protein